MAKPWEDDETRALQLLADQATFGLEADDRQELEGLLSRMRWIAPDAMDRVAAAIQMTCVADHLEPLPSRLHDKLRSSARHALGH
jgi:hypothetical protein